MINGIYIFSSEYELILKRTYAKTLSMEKVVGAIGSDCNFVEIGSETVIHRRFEDVIFCCVTADENEMYILALITMVASTMEKMVGSLSHKLLVYHFRDAYTLIDGFVLNGKVVCLDPTDILSSVGARSSARS